MDSFRTIPDLAYMIFKKSLIQHGATMDNAEPFSVKIQEPSWLNLKWETMTTQVPLNYGSLSHNIWWMGCWEPTQPHLLTFSATGNTFLLWWKNKPLFLGGLKHFQGCRVYRNIARCPGIMKWTTSILIKCHAALCYLRNTAFSAGYFNYFHVIRRHDSIILNNV